MDSHGLKERLFISGSVQRSDASYYSLAIADIGRNRQFAWKEKAEIVRQNQSGQATYPESSELGAISNIQQSELEQRVHAEKSTRE